MSIPCYVWLVLGTTFFYFLQHTLSDNRENMNTPFIRMISLFPSNKNDGGKKHYRCTAPARYEWHVKLEPAYVLPEALLLQ